MSKNGYLEKRKNQIRNAVSSGAQQAADLTKWLSVVALNEEFGFGSARCERFLKRLAIIAEEHNNNCGEDYDYAMEKLRRRLQGILQCAVKRED